MKSETSAATEVMANCRGCGSAWDGRETAPVGSFRPGDFGLYDLLGNVWQWVDDCGAGSVSPGPCDHPAQVRGGAFSTRRGVVASAPNGTLAPEVRDSNIGFRIARDLDAVTTPPATCAAGTDSP
jgi:formylglycine-generating enzyme required for sulfatase activity